MCLKTCLERNLSIFLLEVTKVTKVQATRSLITVRNLTDAVEGLHIYIRARRV